MRSLPSAKFRYKLHMILLIVWSYFWTTQSGNRDNLDDCKEEQAKSLRYRWVI